MSEDPRIEAAAKTAWENPGGPDKHPANPDWATVDPDIQRMYRAEALRILTAADAVDPLRQPGMVTVDTNDGATIDRVAEAIKRTYILTGRNAARAVLAALAERGRS